jgi:predicted alpha/beta-fold hydrolase
LVFKKIHSWINSTLLFNNPHIMWIHGYAGCGKSAIAQVIAEDMSSQGRLAGSFFFFRGAGDRSKAARLATTIASQLAASIPATAPCLAL